VQPIGSIGPQEAMIQEFLRPEFRYKLRDALDGSEGDMVKQAAWISSAVAVPDSLTVSQRLVERCLKMLKALAVVKVWPANSLVLGWTSFLPQEYLQWGFMAVLCRLGGACAPRRLHGG